MRGAFTIGRILGIDLKVHFTFLIILALAALQGYTSAEGANPAGALFNVILVVLLFLCVTLHELGHSVVAQRFGVQVKEIILLPIGGVAMMAKIPEKPVQELLIAIAGPLVNVVILAVLLPIWVIWGGTANGIGLAIFHAGHVAATTDASPAFVMLTMIIAANAMLVLFNLIPAFPLDGGRVLRAVLAFKLPYARATQIAATIGQFAAVAIGIYALLNGQFILAIIAFFIFSGAGAEAHSVQVNSVLSSFRATDAYKRSAIVLTLDTRVSQVIGHLLTSYQSDFAVVNRGRFVGLVTRDQIMSYLANRPSRYDVFVTEVMVDAERVVRVDKSVSLEEISELMAEKEVPLVAVFDADHFLGLLGQRDIAESEPLREVLVAPQEPVQSSSFPQDV